MTDARTPLFTPVLIVGCIIMMLGFAIRASFGGSRRDITGDDMLVWWIGVGPCLQPA